LAVRADFRHVVRGRAARRLIGSLRKTSSYVLVAALSLATLVAISLLAVRVPQWQASIVSIKDPKDRISAENEIFRNIIQSLGGAFFLMGVYFTWRNLRLAQEGQITQRFNDAIEHLGSEKPEVRLGGIYALARIARDSPKDHISVMHVFSSYVRETTKRTAVEPVAPEVQAILTMIARRTVEHESDDDKIDLRDAYIPGVNLRGGQMENVCFDGANLCRATLENALLRGASLRAAVLEDAYLRSADLRATDLTGADLRQASLREALLDGADILGAQLDGTTLLRTDLSGVKNAIRQQIAAAIIDETTTLPVYGDLIRTSTTGGPLIR
jgi:hypothetical protein